MFIILMAYDDAGPAAPRPTMGHRMVDRGVGSIAHTVGADGESEAWTTLRTPTSDNGVKGTMPETGGYHAPVLKIVRQHGTMVQVL